MSCCWFCSPCSSSQTSAATTATTRSNRCRKCKCQWKLVLVALFLVISLLATGLGLLQSLHSITLSNGLVMSKDNNNRLDLPQSILKMSSMFLTTSTIKATNAAPITTIISNDKDQELQGQQQQQQQPKPRVIPKEGAEEGNKKGTDKEGESEEGEDKGENDKDGDAQDDEDDDEEGEEENKGKEEEDGEEEEKDNEEVADNEEKGDAKEQVNKDVEEAVNDDSENQRPREKAIDINDQILYQGQDLHGDSSTATVMGMATGYDVGTYERFVGSLRKSGFQGHIFLGVSADVSQKALDYFEYRGVTPKFFQYADCTYRKSDPNANDIFKKTECEAHYPDIKVRWSRFPLQADWLRECKTCTGPVLIMDVRDSLFQRNPFGEGSPVVKGLQVFEEDPSQTTKHWLTEWPIRECKGVQFEKPMLCSGTTVGTRVAMLKYLEIMYEEMKVWIADPKCRFDINGDDQSIHNYLFYSGKLPFATAIPNRSGGIVNTVGKIGAMILKEHANKMMAQNPGISENKAERMPFEGANDKTWIGVHYNVTDEEGFFTEYDGTRSRVIHQWDRFGSQFWKWLKTQQEELIKDSIPESFTPSKRHQTQSSGGTTYSNLESRANNKNKRRKKQSSGGTTNSNLESPANNKNRILKTETGVDVSDPALFEGVDLRGDSSTATVMGVASGYDLTVYEQFVGTLRKSGFKGHIILGLAPDVKPEVLEYFAYRKVTPKILQWSNCTYRKMETAKNDIFQQTTCEEHYPDIKIRWSRFPLQADWLRECEECTGPVLVMDVRDSFFQLDPFGPGSPPVVGLQVFEEHPSQTTDHWLTKWPIRDCKGITFEKPMLCSGTTVGTRVAMLKYLEIMYEEMKVWISTDKCRFDINGDDQSIHNYLFYTGQLPFATAIPYRSGGIVNTVGKIGAMIVKNHSATMQERHKVEHGEAMWMPFEGAVPGKNWIGTAWNVTDEEGFFTEADGSRSRVIHQWDRFGRPFVNLWMEKNQYFQDPMPKE